MAKAEMVAATDRDRDDTTARPAMHIAVIWQRFLPYHVARLTHLSQQLAASGSRLTALEVASSDSSYPFPPASIKNGAFEHVRCFPESSYHSHTRDEIYDAVFSVLKRLSPDCVLAPATPFPEGMAAVAYRCRHGARMVMMDDAWERTDCSDALTGFIKRLIHRNIDAAFIPAPSHRDHYRMMGFSEDRIVCGVDVVDNDFFSRGADAVRRREEEWRSILLLPKRYFLFVGRFLRRKGIEDLIDAYVRYRNMTDDPWDMVLVGAGPEEDTINNLAARIEGIRLVGPKHGDRLCLYYALAAALVVPSRSDPWGLVVNEGMASGLPVIVSRGCGAARTLVRESENGWAFDQCDRTALAALLHRVGSMSSEHLRRMGDRSRALVAEWCLDTFVQGVLDAAEIPRRTPGGFIADIFTRLWKGRVALT